MCSNPVTATNKETGEVCTFACRKCDDCIATRKNDWVARGVAEMATAEFTYCLNLTYRDNPDGTKPPAARAFKYRDVQLFLKRLRKAAAKEYGKGVEIRYIIAGERGSQRNRVHWHMILYASHDLFRLGKWYDFVFKAIDKPRPAQILPSGRRKLPMDHWDLWPHGHVTTDTASQQSIAYVLKYCIKDMFNVVKSAGTPRISKAENDGAGMFRMSKEPPIGWRFMFAKLARLSATLSVPPSVEIKVPGYSGYWWPRGRAREEYLTGLRSINELCRQEKGRDAPGWSSLIASVSENQKDMELLNGPETQDQDEEYAEFLRRMAEGQRELEAHQHHGQNRDRCGRTRVCAGCFAVLSDEERHDLKEWQALLKQQASLHRRGKRKLKPDAVFRWENRPNPFCQRREEIEASFSLKSRLR
jgi:hypothetical protein